MKYSLPYYTTNENIITCETCKHKQYIKNPTTHQSLPYCQKNGASLENEYLPHPHWCPLWEEHVNKSVEEAMTGLNKQ